MAAASQCEGYFFPPKYWISLCNLYWTTWTRTGPDCFKLIFLCWRYQILPSDAEGLLTWLHLTWDSPHSTPRSPLQPQPWVTGSPARGRGFSSLVTRVRYVGYQAALRGYTTNKLSRFTRLSSTEPSPPGTSRNSSPWPWDSTDWPTWFWRRRETPSLLSALPCSATTAG